MQPVQTLAQGREQDAIQKLGQSQQYLDGQRARLEELRAYREQYAREFAESGQGGLTATRIQDYRAFLNRLSEAIGKQEVLLCRCEVQHEQTRQQWLESRRHSQAIDRVVKGYQQEENRQEERREQKEQDERAQRPLRK
jgi:flagellar FliJ protein